MPDENGEMYVVSQGKRYEPKILCPSELTFGDKGHRQTITNG